MPFGRALCSIVRECSLSVHEYHWPIVGQNTGRHTSFGTRGAQVQILPLRPLLSSFSNTNPDSFPDRYDATVRRGCVYEAPAALATGTVIGTETPGIF